MVDQFVQALDVGIPLVLVSIGVVLVVRFIQSARLRRLILAVRKGLLPAEKAYANFIKAGTNLWRFAYIFLFSLFFLVLLGLAFFRYVGDVLGAFEPGAFLMVAGVYLTLFPLLDTLLSSRTDARASRELSNSQLRTRSVLNIRLRRSLFKVFAMLVFTEALGIGFAAGARRQLWLVPLGAVVWCLFRVFFAGPNMTWRECAQPIARTRWKELEPRIAAWARLAGVKIGGAYITNAALTGQAHLFIAGLVRPRLFLSDAFLDQSDWRQQDAYIAQELGMVRARTTLWGALIQTAQPVFATAIVVCVLLIWPPSAMNLLSVGTVIGVGFALIIGSQALGLLYGVVSGLVQQRILLNGYRFGVYLCGDYYATAVSTVTAYQITRQHWLMARPGFPSSGTRWQQKERKRLEAELASKPAPRAPWAADPVPSIYSFTVGRHEHTVPLDQAPPPAPVPTALYPNAELSIPFSPSASSDSPAAPEA
jgi:hypothetical protein